MARPPIRLDGVGRHDHQHRKGLDASIVVDIIEGMEFRSQISTALRRRPHAPSPPPVRVPTGGKRPMPPGTMQMDANDRWPQRQSWPPPQLMAPAAAQRFRQPPSRPEPQSLPWEASRAAESSCLASASAAAAAAAAAEADQADQFLLKVKQTLGHGDKHRLFMEVCALHVHVHWMCTAFALHVRCVCAACALHHVHCMCAACALQVMMGFQSNILDTVEVMEQVSALLQGHSSLLRQFNEYLSVVEAVVLVAAEPEPAEPAASGHRAPTCLRRAALWAREEKARRLYAEARLRWRSGACP